MDERREPSRRPTPEPQPASDTAARRQPRSQSRDSSPLPAGLAHGHHHHHGSDEERRAGRQVAARDHGLMMERPTTFWGRLRQFVWGFLYFDWYHELQHERTKYKDVLNLVLFGELIGIPLMNSSIGLRLLPYALPDLSSWKHRQLEEFDLVEHGPHIH